MKVAFRADASLQIGTGHVMRCLTLADALRVRGAETYFVTRGQAGVITTEIERRGHGLYRLVDDPSAAIDSSAPMLAHSDWLSVSQIFDAQQTLLALDSLQIDWLVVDHYALDTVWEKTVALLGCRLVAIDDLADRHHSVDILIDQNLGRSWADYRDLLSENTRTLIGSEYAILRPEFIEFRDQSLVFRSVRNIVQNILISMGGVDRDNSTFEVLKALELCHKKNTFHITAIMGSQAPWLSMIRDYADNSSLSIDVLSGVSDMGRLMSVNDVAIGAAGGTAWERCCMGLPTLTVILAENQVDGAIALEKAGAIRAIKCAAEVSHELPRLLDSLTGEPSDLRAMAANASALVDGRGVRRIMDQIWSER